jgi:Uma2 family endonuclease
MSTIARFSLAEYDDMIARGVFDGPHKRRIELIEGELRDMSPIGPVHEYEVDVLNDWSHENAPREEVLVRVQNSIGLSDLDSAPEPDLTWVKRRDYRKRRPSAADVLLLIEVSDSSLEYDRGEKATLFATAGIADYWIVNIPQRCVEVRRDPMGDTYAELRTYRPGDLIRPLAFPDLAFPVSLLFPEDEDQAA